MNLEGGASPSTNTWSCSKCTYINTSTSTNCELCGTEDSKKN
jgi:RNA polymerase subunit RPABC4/transcription elongation factor Spt4